jgi:hypothetical protein
VPRFRFTRLTDKAEQRAGWVLLRYEHNLCFFLEEVPEDQTNGD